ncbi:MAG: helix-turn-helix transcriptional regulator [Pseudoxanthomonas sp.]
MNTLGDRLRAAREAERFSQLSASAELGVTKGALSAWENDKNFPQLETFMQLCTLYRASADSLLFPTRVAAEHPEYLSPVKRKAIDRISALTDAQCAGLLEMLRDR